MPAQYPGIGYVAGSEVSLLRRICNNTALMAEAFPSGIIPSFVPVPATPASPGVPGDMAEDGSYLYIYSSVAGQWLRVGLNDWTP